MARILETRADENKSRILCSTNHSLCFIEYLKDIATSQADVFQQLPHQRSKNGELKETSKEEVESENINVTKARHNKIRRSKHSRRILEYHIVDLDNHISSCIQTISTFQQDNIFNKMNHDYVLITRVKVHENVADVKDDISFHH